ncbi:hypothetical protein HFP15_37180 [Amycolatopsis sp. K13G38]|uniref:Potassium-transporting ATPase subunit F n=1 Tax=Amycolatopsis acididurans TaxID=2724524 RepID=A0ABX1JFC8_9PSEU|nr:hypothetical protein [Amycolatopsis acididurans]NKQ58498.1 hypothetical protein [Amycolatopsis acididurans]
MVLAGAAMFVLALGYLVLAVMSGSFGNDEGPAEPELDRALEEVVS